jgi:hypothetical protein
LLVDQSSSMEEDFDNTDRWNAVQNALTTPTTGVVAQLETAVRFGLTLFTSFNGSDGGTCPVLTTVAPGLNNHLEIREQWLDEDPEDETPTGESLAAVTASLLADPDPGPKVIVLATDGEPDTCAQANPNEGQALAVAAAEDAFAAGIRTFIISVGDNVGANHLQDMANAGAGVGAGDPDATYYVPDDQDAMVEAFESIINGVRQCTFTLDTPILPGWESAGTVTINGVEIPYDDPDGWRINTPTEIELLGSSCEAVQAGEVEIAIEFSCEAIDPM